jgi:transcriptional regulator with PAS, ATPase and Fis domain
MNDLKQMIYDVANHQGYTPMDPATKNNLVPVYNDNDHALNVGSYSNTPILIDAGTQHEEAEETLSLMDKEKEFISRALKKHKSRRRDAATELGISERTLYRKIKEYGIKE